MQALGWSGQRPGTGTGGGSGPPNCGGTTTRRPDPERSEPSVSDWTANYIGRGRKPARGPLPQDGKRGCRGGARREQVHTSRGPIRGPNDYPHHQATTWPKGLGKRSGSRSDGPEACSPGEGREPPRSLDGRGRVTGSPKYDSDHSQARSESGAALPAPGDGPGEHRQPRRVPQEHPSAPSGGLVSAVRRGVSGNGPLDRAPAPATRPGTLNGRPTPGSLTAQAETLTGQCDNGQCWKSTSRRPKRSPGAGP